MKQILENLKALGTRRLIALGGVGAAVIAFTVIAALYLVQPEYRPLSTGLSSTEASRIMTELETAGYKPQVSNDGATVMLPSGDIARARMVIASAGLVGNSVPGWELFDASPGLGTTSFTQRIQRLRALEGELIRSIVTMEPVEDARVHIVLPEREAFSQDRPVASASVVVKTARGLPLERVNAIAIRNLVANAIPDLAADRVTILSASGETILSAESDNPGSAGSEQRLNIEDRIATNIESIISARVGAGNVRVRVTADISSERRIEVSQSYDPDQQVASRVMTMDEQNSSSDGSSGSVDVANNMPGFETGAGSGSTSQEDRSRSQNETDYVIGNTRTERVIEPGELRRLSVAILVNGTMDGETYVERTAEELADLEVLARSAAGVSEERGDVLEVRSLRFADGVYDFASDTPWYRSLLEDNLGLLIKAGIFLGALLILAIFLFRPVLRRIFGDDRMQVAQAAPMDQATGMPRGEDTDTAVQDPAPASATQDDEGERMQIHSVSGGVLKKHIRMVGEMVDANPEESVRIMRGWLNQKSSLMVKDEPVHP
ncbi:flagellar basal-body MS-ring/collar protein FliF [Paracoccus sp. ME4]|uniref:flagellar basal-body MS-ring/collar protein FliF n=1 Tax=Paracoccus sp. ME4 TaxID=3138066 RepID=UPI00398AC489